MAEMLEAALHYLYRYRIPVIPIEPRGKKPLVSWNKYQKDMPTDKLVRNWWSKWPDANIGIVTGEVSEPVGNRRGLRGRGQGAGSLYSRRMGYSYGNDASRGNPLLLPIREGGWATMRGAFAESISEGTADTWSRLRA